LPKKKPIEIWFQYEARIGQKNPNAGIWAKRRTRLRKAADQRYKSVYLFGAICPTLGKGAAVVLPHSDTQMMQWHLDKISLTVAPNAHGLILIDRAGRHTTGKLDVPRSITIILLPSKSPELNPVKNIWQYLRQN